ncbi:MAG: Gfo/Idh/MocA family oxidoreductase [Anaerolineae bacterium]|nr:Gfo/Idh/MocA family oxidoreductase [Anaerolineae bacterium]
MDQPSHTDPLRVALIGTGFGGRVQLPGFLSYAETNVVALCGRSEEKTRHIANQHGVRAVYTDFEQMLVDIKPDLMSITAPPRWHAYMAIAALQVGAHVLCEKPLAMNTAEAQEMIDVARQYERVHTVDFEFRYLPARYYQRVLVDQGFIGEPLLLEGTYMSAMRWDPNRAWDWWMDAEQGGGLLGAIGSHFIDAFRWLSGREVRSVTASLHTTPHYRYRLLPDGSGKREVTSDDGTLLSLEMSGGLRGVINMSAVAGGETQRLAIHGTEGALVVINDTELWGRRRGEPLQPIEIPLEYEPPVWLPDENLLLGPFIKLLGLTVDTIRDRAVLKPPTFEDGLVVQRVLDAAYRSNQEGCRIDI